MAIPKENYPFSGAMLVAGRVALDGSTSCNDKNYSIANAPTGSAGEESVSSCWVAVAGFWWVLVVVVVDVVDVVVVAVDVVDVVDVIDVVDVVDVVVVVVVDVVVCCCCCCC